MRSSTALALVTIATFIPSGTLALAPRPRAATQCSWGGNTFSLPDAPKASVVGSYNSVEIKARMLGEQGAQFSFFRSRVQVFSKSIADVYNPNGWVGVSSDSLNFALNTSNGGAAGGWSVAIVRVPPLGPAVDLTNSIKVIEADFSKRHYCKARGDNYEAIQWRSNTQLLVSASVYGTSDCGADMGHTEGYVLDVVSDRIILHLTKTQMLNLPYICTYNVWRPGDPNPR